MQLLPPHRVRRIGACGVRFLQPRLAPEPVEERNREAHRQVVRLPREVEREVVVVGPNRRFLLGCERNRAALPRDARHPGTDADRVRGKAAGARVQRLRLRLRNQAVHVGLALRERAHRGTERKRRRVLAACRADAGLRGSLTRLHGRQRRILAPRGLQQVANLEVRDRHWQVRGQLQGVGHRNAQLLKESQPLDLGGVPGPQRGHFLLAEADFRALHIERGGRPDPGTRLGQFELEALLDHQGVLEIGARLRLQRQQVLPRDVVVEREERSLDVRIGGIEVGVRSLDIVEAVPAQALVGREVPRRREDV